MNFVEKAKKLLLGFIEKTKQLLDFRASLLFQKRKTVLLVAVVIAVTLLVSSLVAIWLSDVFNVHLPSIGTIRTTGLQAYWDPVLTNETTTIRWGLLYPGSATNATVYLRSISNIPVTLEMTTANWTLSNSRNEIVYGPANSTDHITLFWDYNGSAIDPDQAIPVVFTLRMDSTLGFIEYVIENDVQSFRFDINVHAR